ncbi:HAD-IC family P-type ATPase [Methanospirillum sp. J.3.6.1-F.2.7.3]|uniref:HAD-IC family P-type ATPase n=1 Tax=Methanospirillum purgamenti TaxID=2834276 RepID=A0A8E7AWW3_9EURY|nr:MULTISPECIES: HAD-IC family P-type ATPase [Methanospirillum]MDX8550503.1 HAD-IC family P-type ATPase [Methanospirillum hungatei]QVV88240.1 HAD-IC family P-type ATPase [Methanospirillum sp. J.3.6.1-F.2.7.3]
MVPDSSSHCRKGISWQSLSEPVVREKLATGPNGLSSKEAVTRIQEFGKNELPEAKKVSVFAIFLSQFKSPLIYVLIAAALLSWFLDHLTDTAFITVVILINAIIGTIQEWKAEQSAKALQQLFRITAVVTRDGQEVRIPAEELVPGDYVFLEAGTRVPADLRITQVADCSIDESVLTGESVPVTKQVTVLPEEIPISDQENMAFAGTTVVRGICRGYIVNTGICTEVGKIAVAVADTTLSKPPLIIRMEKFSQHIAVAVLIATAILGVIAVYQGMGIIDVFFFAVALAVSAIPEGLPVALTVVLSIAAHRMAGRNVIVRKMTAVESLGSCTLIASDKTGTLTMNEQTAHIVLLPERESYEVTGTGYTGEGTIQTTSGEVLPESARSQIQRLCHIASLCSEAHLDKNQNRWHHSGDPIDVAFLALARKSGLDTTLIQKSVERPLFIPFEAERRYSAAGFIDSEGERFGIKGAAEAVLPYCTRMRTPTGDMDVDQVRLLAKAEELAENGYRVLAVAEAVSPGIPKDPIKSGLPSLVLLGYIGFIDPVRPDARSSVESCQKAGVTVVMVTGDHPATALAIAKTLGIAHNQDQVLTGMEIDALGSVEIPEFFDLVQKARVFARVTPVQKLSIVDALIRMGHFVAVTGDGVNDAPALRRAHIGVAMGSGTDIAKDNASMIITDDRFSSIVAGIEEGRYAYDNIRKVTYLLVSTGAAEVILFTCSLIAHLPLPLLAVQLLWLNLVTNGIQHVGLAFEPGEKGAMNRPPRPPSQGIFNRLMISQILVSSVIMGIIGFIAWYYMISTGVEENTARNLAVLLFVLLENVHVFNCRSEFVSAFRMPLSRNLFLVGSVIAAQAIHQIAMHIPVLQDVLGLEPVTLTQWGILFAAACVIVVVMEIFKVVWPKVVKTE